MPFHSPTIVIGMHRSGTSLLTRILKQLGLFAGARTEENDEAIFFQRENDWVLKRAGATWDNPQPVKALLLHQELHDLCCQRLVRRVRSPRASRYLGLRRYLAYRSVLELDFAWGWKDPCNTFVLPLWLDVYPGAKIVHIHRHGVDVAQSLVKREVEKAATRWATTTRRQILGYIRRYPSRATPSRRCRTLEGAFSLWEEYMVEARRHVAELGPRAFELSYEQFLKAPQDNLERLAGFCGLCLDDRALSQAVGAITRSRMEAFRRDKSLVAFAQTVSGRLGVHGY